MSLKKDLKNNLEHLLQETHRKEREIEEDLDSLKSFNPEKAKYRIVLRSRWIDHGEQSTTTEHEGDITYALTKAASGFKKVNKRDDVQANWEVFVELGNREHKIPEKYFEKYKPKY